MGKKKAKKGFFAYNCFRVIASFKPFMSNPIPDLALL